MWQSLLDHRDIWLGAYFFPIFLYVKNTLEKSGKRGDLPFFMGRKENSLEC